MKTIILAIVMTASSMTTIAQTFEKFDKYILSRNMPLVIDEYGALFCYGVYAQGPITNEDQEEGAKYVRLMVEEGTKTVEAII